ncbi:BREX-2 system phosphatase PglZ [Spongiactinospora sp. TRM90649]|uniref:BREX-2 system phosphatase PglZ n=1 Tax=Spongiactinospora sp. TRM90649 TaxID=3031114 RepID=UPI0023F7B9AE|nr:BREX-2 system phosphatase PglZ [Spongiactinospora sp. TRM90649]MDF5759286.1 BREX-2 system phosphatase PglZ [Spongiactinospora sp. TRM90649]
MSAAVTAAGVMRLTTATITQFLSAQKSLADSLNGTGRRRVVLLRSAPQWDGPDELVWGEEQRARIAAAPSPLAVHELVLGHLAGDVAGPPVLAVLTDREQNELDPAILARAHKQRIEAVDGWDVVREAFGVEQVDGRLMADAWAAEALLDATPPGGWPPLAGGWLSRRTALSALAARRLRFGRYDTDGTTPGTGRARGDDGLDIHTLLRWSLTPGGPDRLPALRGPERAGLSAFLGEEDQAGLAGRALLALVGAGYGADAVPFGLLCAALWLHAGTDAQTYRLRGRAERWFGEEPPAMGEALDTLAAAFGRSCEEFVTASLEAGRTGADEGAAREARRITGTVLDRAAALARQFGAEDAVRASPVLAAGLEARFAQVGRALAGDKPDVVADAVRALDAHHMAAEPDERVRIERARMGQRLARWLATDPPVDADTVAAAIERHVAETGWVDQALEHVAAGGDPDPDLKAAYDTLGTRVRRRRREIDRAFARTLATWTAAGTDPGSMLTVESFLTRVVKPVVAARAGRRVLLLVLDGMSAAIAAELGEELRRHWAEYDPVVDQADRPPRRRAMAAALPTLTGISRTSLFAGRLMKGTQVDEQRLFPAHRFWGGVPAAVFHKDDLRGESAGDPFGPDLSAALAEEHTHVAVVLNTIDDRLGKEQKLGDGTWRLDQVGKLRELLRVAAAQGMAVILTSDHGHVVDRHGVKAEGDGIASARHRVPGGAMGATEIALSGPRVVWPQPGAAIVALWDADSRYTAQKAGYHGGASLAEVTIPVLAFLQFGAEPPKGWRELGDQRPAWWSPEAEAARPAPPIATAPEPKRRTRTPKPSKNAGIGEALFDVVLAPADDALLAPRLVSPDDALVGALLESEIFQAQVGLLARKPPLDKVEKAVRALLGTGALPVTALAQRVGYPPGRADGFAAVLRQLLNYDGVQVLATLPDGRTLRLDTALLRDQFELA